MIIKNTMYIIKNDSMYFQERIMAKKQTFGDKTAKQGNKKGTFIKLVRAIKTDKGTL